LKGTISSAVSLTSDMAIYAKFIFCMKSKFYIKIEIESKVFVLLKIGFQKNYILSLQKQIE